jgi:hypothetical protein
MIQRVERCVGCGALEELGEVNKEPMCFDCFVAANPQLFYREPLSVLMPPLDEDGERERWASSFRAGKRPAFFSVHHEASAEGTGRIQRRDAPAQASGGPTQEPGGADVSEQRQPPSLRAVCEINEPHRAGSGVYRLVTLVEIWDERVVLRWVEFPWWPDAAPRIEKDRGPRLGDDAGTSYRRGGGGGGGGRDWSDLYVGFTPSPPPEATQLHIEWAEGEKTVVRLARS